jgi:hypothetical protein
MKRLMAFVVGAAMAGAWFWMLSDALARTDDHRERIMACMSTTRKAQHVSPEEAYLLCERAAH